MTLAIVLALKKEAQWIFQHYGFRRLSAPSSAKFYTLSDNSEQDSLLLCISGMGHVRMKSCMVYLLEHHAVDAVVNIGTAASLDPNITLHQIVTLTHIYDLLEFESQHESATLDSYPCITSSLNLASLLKTSQSGYGLSVMKPIVSASHPIHSLVKKPGAVVDMEGATCATYCSKAGVAWGAIKVVSDYGDGRSWFHFFSSLARIQQRIGLVFEMLHSFQLSNRLFYHGD
jgi:nucleoside phosphorylase